MKVAYLVGIGGSLLVAAAITGGACTYTTYTIEPTGTTSGGGGGVTTIATSGSASATSGGTGGAGGASCDAGTCDKDCDGVQSTACDGGLDCDDGNRFIHGGQAVWFTTPIMGTTSFDYNCNGMQELQYTDILACPDGLKGCDEKTAKWMSSLPACGATADYGVCEVTLQLPPCKKKKLGTATQGCR